MTIKRAGNFKAYAGLVERVKNAIFTPQQVSCSFPFLVPAVQRLHAASACRSP